MAASCMTTNVTFSTHMQQRLIYSMNLQCFRVASKAKHTEEWLFPSCRSTGNSSVQQSKRNRTRLRTKRNNLVAGASPTHVNFRSRCCDLSDTFFGMSFGLTRQLLMQLGTQITTSMRFLLVPANRGFLIQKRRCRCYY